jgi:succinoglycan biosynthesis protein ExoL
MLKEEYQIIFISSSKPSPVMLERIKIAKDNNKNPLCIVWNRNEFFQLKSNLDFDIITYNIGNIKFFFTRFLKIINFYFWLYRLFYTKKINNVDIFCDSLDLLFIVVFLKKRYNLYIRYCVEDLNQLQLNTNLSGIIFRFFESFINRYVDLLIVTSPMFIESYYLSFLKCKYIIVENVPKRNVWNNFQRQTANRNFKIAFIGIIRYFNCLKALVIASRVLFKNGHKLQISFIGDGDDYEKLKQFCKGDDFIKFTGSYNYDQDICNLYSDVDLIYSVYDYDISNVRLAMPNKFYESLITKIPILVSSNTYLESRVKEYGIGLGVNYKNILELVHILTQAVNKVGWYLEAENNSSNFNSIEEYFDNNELAMTNSILKY